MMKLLFICTHNACRSILAEAIARRLGKGRLVTASAGSAPSGRVHPLTLQFLAARGYDTGGLRSKGLDAVADFAPDVVTTVCDRAAAESCPLWLNPGVATVHWGLPDPSQQSGSEQQVRQSFDAVIDTIERRINSLLRCDFENLDAQSRRRLMTQLAEDDHGPV